MTTKITVTGWVGTQPRLFVSENGTSFTSFRLGSTKRFFDRAQDRWVDGATTWFTVKSWRSTAVNVAESLRRSDPVLVHGTLSTEVWDSPEGPRTTCVIEADALGPDVARGQATFRHTVHTRAPGEGTPGSPGGEGTGSDDGAEAADSAPGTAGDSARGAAAEPVDLAPEDPWAVDAEDLGPDAGPAGARAGVPGTDSEDEVAAGTEPVFAAAG